MAEEKLYDPLTRQNLDVVDMTEEAARATAGDLPDEEEVAFFVQLRRHLLPRGAALDLGKCPPSGDGAAVGTYFGKNIIGFNTRTAIFWRIIAPEFLGGTSHELVYLTSSNHARRGPEALVRYKGGLPATFRVWDWAHPFHPKYGRFVIAIPHATWGPHRLQINVDGEAHFGLQVANSTHFDGSTWLNQVLWYNGETNSWDLVWRYAFNWNPEEECKFFFFGPCIEPKGASGYGTTNKLGYAEATLATDIVQIQLLANNSRLVTNNFGFEVTNLVPNHTVLAQ